MIKVEWSPKFEVGHERIDFEHRIFLNLIREASLLEDRGTSKERIMKHLDEVKRYTQFHFTSEENIMFDVAYPEIETHQQEHARLIAQFDEKAYRYRSGESGLDEVVAFMFEWFALHTTQVDTRLAQYIAQA
jgi:hemerythrin